MALAIAATGVVGAQTQGGEETFVATASVKTAAGAYLTAPVTIVVSRTMTPDEAAKYTSAFVSGGVAALRKTWDGVQPTGSIRIGSGEAIPTRLTIERTTEKGRLLTAVTDRPLVHLGAGLPEAKSKAGYDFAVLDIEIDASGAGSGTLAPAAKVRVNNGAFVVDDYGSESIRLAGVKRAR